MALVIPAAKSTIVEATSNPGGVMSKYILAQLPDDVSLDWLIDVRSLCDVSELKWKLFQARREHLQGKTELWPRIQASMRSATIVIINPGEVESSLRLELNSQGAEEGLDFDQQGLTKICATAIIAGTPVAYLPNHLSETLGLYPQDLYLSFDKFSPLQIQKRVGGNLRDAKIFAARAHAIFDVDSLAFQRHSTTDVFKSPGASLVFRELLSTQRGFDNEHPKSTVVLNEAAETIAGALKNVLTSPGKTTENLLVKEYDSRDIDFLQAADIAAGWAHELVALGDERALGYTFGRVIINGRIMR